MSTPIRVLIVDDSEDDALLLCRQLRSDGYEPSFGRVDTAEALDAALERQAWDIVLSDFVMPQFNGLEAVRQVKGKGLDIPIIIVSGRIGEETAVDCMLAGADDYIMKDNMKRLGAAVARELREAENRANRRIAEERFRTAETNFRQVITSSADGIVIVDKDGAIRFVNPSAEALFCRSSGDMVGTPFAFPIVEKAEIEIPRGDDGTVTAEMRIVETDWEGTPAYVATLRDVTERKRNMIALQDSEAKLRLLLDQIPCVSWTTDTSLRFTSTRGTETEIMRFLPQQTVGITLMEYFKIGDADFDPYVAHRRALQGISSTFELSRSGHTFYSRVEPLRDPGNLIVGVVGVTFDITERKRSEEQLRHLSQRLVSLQENERRAIARELHDEIGQSLTALKLFMDRASAVQLGTDNAGLQEARKTLRELMGRIRDMSLDLRPTMLDDLGLLPTLMWHFKRYTAQTRVRVDFRHSGLQMELPPEVVSAAYRIVQEALTNVARHAQVSDVVVSVCTDNDALVLEVEDQGAGFDLNKIAPSSIGLNSMRERALSLNGKLMVRSAPGEGTCLIAELPLSREERVAKGKRKRSR